MHVIVHASDAQALGTGATYDAGEVGMDVGQHVGAEERDSVLGAKDEMDQDVREGLAMAPVRPRT